ncbi:3-oxoacyl-[acyl-carrier protein] reductase [Serinicoccus hydrothermalis]|uniref:3-oxoacyl-[acyl-carrier protein] reductase n=1 Tax=Serinicoccus hydrothermalis TaxID=1758689 RepID=A0A1B1NFP6_9MICO|nr:3-oxoacyl-ACP reductase [Serinicoccus hydrothermalis]ANS80248.1 3-oxoacyl-[acyl-carrier protein] reductase [Serinicoccus hydrothermalis]
MADLMQMLTTNPLARQLGVPQPTRLRRGRELPSGTVALGSAGGGRLAARTLELLGVPVRDALVDTAQTRVAETTDDGRTREVPEAYPSKIGALVLDATAATSLADLETVRGLLRPAMKGLEPSGRVVVLGVDPETAGAPTAVATQQALEGIVRSVGKELRAGATANLVRVDLLTSEPTTAAELASTLSFLLEGRSAYVSGQVLRLGHAAVEPGQVEARPFEGRIVVVTGAGRGIGTGIARTFARDGALVVAVDVPAAGQGLAEVANGIGGTALQLDITAADAGSRIAAHVAQRFGDAARIHAIVHNAGITRDKLLANTDEERWGSVLEVNLAAQIQINEVLLDPDLPGGLDEGGRIIGVASTSGIAGNRGQANYAASKAGVIGLVRAMGADPRLAGRGITVNAVAPGFIETEMTGKMPVATREVARRINSLQQGGKPVDVAETIGYLADPASSAVTGQVVRVCGQSQIGA